MSFFFFTRITWTYLDVMIFGTCCNDILAWNSGVHSQTHDSCLVTPSKLSYSCVPAKNMLCLYCSSKIINPFVCISLILKISTTKYTLIFTTGKRKITVETNILSQVPYSNNIASSWVENISRSGCSYVCDESLSWWHLKRPWLSAWLHWPGGS